MATDFILIIFLLFKFNLIILRAKTSNSDVKSIGNWLNLENNTEKSPTLSIPRENCPDNKKCVKCRVRSAPNPTDPLCTCCGNPKQCLHQHLCVPMELFCSKGHYLRYSKKQNAHVCFPCPLGQYCNHRYCRYKCISCNVGHEAAEAGATQCTQCRKGFFKAEITTAQCQECPYGYSTNNTGAEECTAVDGVGIDEPTECDRTLCIPCMKLPENASLTHSLCTCCPEGMCSYREKCAQFKIPCENGVLNQSGFCQFCPGGTYCDKQFCDTCLPCPAGTEKAVNAYGECQLCKPGYFKTIENKEMCSPCPLGYYSIFEGSQSCVQCPENHFCPSSSQPPFICPTEYICSVGTSFPIPRAPLKEDVLISKMRMYEPPSSTFSLCINNALIIIITACLIYALY